MGECIYICSVFFFACNVNMRGKRAHSTYLKIMCYRIGTKFSGTITFFLRFEVVNVRFFLFVLTDDVITFVVLLLYYIDEGLTSLMDLSLSDNLKNSNVFHMILY